MIKILTVGLYPASMQLEPIVLHALIPQGVSDQETLIGVAAPVSAVVQSQLDDMI